MSFFLVVSLYRVLFKLHYTDQSSHPVSDFSCAFKSVTMVTGIAADCVGACEASVRARSAVEVIPRLQHLTSHFHALISAIMVSTGDTQKKEIKLIRSFNERLTEYRKRRTWIKSEKHKSMLLL